jgi:hypothetical protein
MKILSRDLAKAVLKQAGFFKRSDLSAARAR